MSAETVLLAVRARVEAGQLVQHMWRCGDERACLHTMLQEAVSAERKGYIPTPLDGQVFWPVWLSLPEWADRSIPTFIDRSISPKDDALTVLDAALDRVRTAPSEGDPRP